MNDTYLVDTGDYDGYCTFSDLEEARAFARKNVANSKIEGLYSVCLIYRLEETIVGEGPDHE